MNNKLEVIGIDHGWSMMKTVTQVFVTGVKEITTTPALFGDVLEYDGKYYKIGTVRQEVKDTKVEDDSFYLLTLAAVAKELKKRGLSDAKVFLAVGLPLTRFGAERNNFIKYLTKNKRVDFRYENEASLVFAMLGQSPVSFKGGGPWAVIEGIEPIFVAVGSSLVVLFFVIGFCSESIDVKKEMRFESILRMLIRLELAAVFVQVIAGAAAYKAIH